MFSFLEVDDTYNINKVLADIEKFNITLNLEQFIEFEYFVTDEIKKYESLDFIEEINKIENFNFKISFDEKILKDKFIFFKIFNLAFNNSYVEAEKYFTILKRRKADRVTINKSIFALGFSNQNNNNYYRAFIYYEQIISNLSEVKRNPIEDNLLLGCYINSSNLYSRSNDTKNALKVIAKAKKNPSFYERSIFYLILINEIEAKVKAKEINYAEALDESIKIEEELVIPKLGLEKGFSKVRQYLKIQQLEICIYLKNFDCAESILDFFKENKIIDEVNLKSRFNLCEIEYFYLKNENEKSFELVDKYIEGLKHQLTYDYEFAIKIFNRTIIYYKELKDYEQLSKFLGIFHELNNVEIEQQKQIQIQLAEAEFSLENKVREFEILNKLKIAEKKQNNILKEKNKELERFAYILAHDIKNPIRQIGNLVEIIFAKNKLIKHEKLQMIEIVKNSSNHVNELVNSILEYTTFDEVKKNNQTVDFNEVLHQCINKLDDKIKLSKAEIYYDKSAKNKVCMNENALCKIIINLLDNSIKFSKNDYSPEIIVSHQNTKFGFEFIIKDNGIGIESTSQEDVFKSFTKNHINFKFIGLGLGLATCQKILNLYNGEIKMKSVKNEGTEFLIKIPFYKNKQIAH